MIVDFKYVQEVQKNFLEHLKKKKGINYQDDKFNVPMWLILALQTELGEVTNASQVNKWWFKEKINRKRLIEELSDLLSYIGSLANTLEVELVLNIEKVQVIAIESTVNNLAYRITTLNRNKRHARSTLINYIIPLFIELVYSLGYNLDELEETYKCKMGEKYLRFI
ncbi:dUTP diphosphatase [Clostridium sp. CCUG 7971]|uniref:dUTP diphosphatase n=1 Tax=Clostridium sp. CCUG 7971 TaxID=2811414 RepID=UPI001ABAD710|nr:dUTP diphosphatase [Clostridium sp. CCUG 7971]MBO3444836.1 dUTP diphosphatase [Clostridium sp. CCUG 7971]